MTCQEFDSLVRADDTCDIEVLYEGREHFLICEHCQMAFGSIFWFLQKLIRVGEMLLATPLDDLSPKDRKFRSHFIPRRPPRREKPLL